MLRLPVLLLVLGLVLWPGLLKAEKIYTWKDKNGVLNMTNSPSTVPSEIRDIQGIGEIKPVAQPVAPAVPEVQAVSPPSLPPPPPVGELKGKDGEKSLRQSVKNIEKRNDAIERLREVLNKLTK